MVVGWLVPYGPLVVVVVAVGFLVEAALLVRADSVWVPQMWIAPFSWLEIVEVQAGRWKLAGSVSVWRGLLLVWAWVVLVSRFAEAVGWAAFPWIWVV
jgi:hypothetical protein